MFSVGDAHLEKFAWVAREAVEKLLELPPTEPALCVESRSRSVVVSPAKGGLRDAVAAVVAPDADFCVCLEDEESVMLECVSTHPTPPPHTHTHTYLTPLLE